MKVLDYYDEKMVAKACPVSWRMLLGLAAGSCMAAIIWGIVYNGKSPSEIPIVSFILLAVCLISFAVCLWLGLINTDTTPRSDVQENLKEYRRLRKETLEQHPYKYSIFTGYEHPYQEILCDAFFVNNDGLVAAVSPYIWVNDITNVRWNNYLFIIDNTDGHKMLAKELKAFLVNRIQSKNRSRSASRKGAVK